MKAPTFPRLNVVRPVWRVTSPMGGRSCFPMVVPAACRGHRRQGVMPNSHAPSHQRAQDKRSHQGP